MIPNLKHRIYSIYILEFADFSFVFPITINTDRLIQKFKFNNTNANYIVLTIILYR